MEATETTHTLESYFTRFREKVIGHDLAFETPYGMQKLIYADWTASGRMYEPIEKRLLEEIAPYVGNTHTESSMTGAVMTKAYHSALQFIKKQVGADENDVIISSGSGMTGVVNKFQRMLGLRLHEKYIPLISIPENKKPVVFVSHMEHHSNQTSWLETMADVEIIQPTEDGLVDVQHLKELLKRYSGRETKIAAITSCSNVTGIFTPYFEVAEIMHRHGGLCFVDFACSAPYININMHPGNPLQKLDAIYFSPHKFLGGPGTSGILVFDSKLYHNRIPDDPGGGTVDWTNPWGERKYIDDIEMREDGGTPAFIQTIKVALCMKLKEEMGINQMLAREEEMLAKAWDELNGIPNLHILANRHQKRLSIISFYIDGLHYNLAVRILNDRFGIQVRGGCSCAGTYGHYLLNVDREHSKSITEKINIGDLSEKPGWIRFSFHPVMSNDEAGFIVDAIRQLCEHFNEWKKDYVYNQHSNTFSHVQDKPDHRVEEWFEESLI